MAWQGHFYARRGESLVALDMNKYEEIRRQTVNEDWTAEIVADATIDDLDKEAIAKAREGYKQRYPTLAKECDGWEDKVFLDKAGLTIDGNYSLMLLANQDMSLMDAVLLNLVQKEKPINNNAIKKLRKEGLIEGRKPHLYVSKQIAKATNTQVEYTLKKGFNDAECQEWIMKALNDHKFLSRKQINELLWNKLPVDFTEEQKMDKIKNLLYKMHKNDEIWLDEDRMWHRKES
jgi:ATP-dependent DNA helicase RecG